MEPVNLNFYGVKRKCINAARRRTELKPAARILLMELLSRQNQAWKGVWPSQANMAESTGISRRSINNQLAELLEANLISPIGKIERQGSRHPVIIYQCTELQGFYQEQGIQNLTSEKTKVIHKVIHNLSAPGAKIALESSAKIAL